MDHEGEVPESLVAETRDKKAALRLLRKAMTRQGPAAIVATDRLRAYGAALRDIDAAGRQETGRWATNRAETSQLPFRRRDRPMPRFRRLRSLPKVAAVHASVADRFNTERSLASRDLVEANRAVALEEWRQRGAARRQGGRGEPRRDPAR